VEKHLRKHSTIKVKKCKYFNNNKIFCPFDKLGCKFGHNENIQDGHLTTDNSKMMLEEPLEERKSDSDEDKFPVTTSNELVMDIDNEVFESQFETKSFDTIEDTLFCTSTPKRSFPCEDCDIGSECVDCFVLHVLGRHGLRRAAFPHVDILPKYRAQQVLL
jgi:hypothetical protein